MPSAVRPLYPLTSFRFFAAAAIVTLHSVASHQLYLREGVAFFYVLSGFILVHVHPTISSTLAMLRFWTARFARIWPLHLGVFLYVFLLPTGVVIQRHYWWAAVLNVVLLQSWVPISRIDLAFDGGSWSLSVEFFFYLLFPLLLPLVSKAPGKMLLLACLLRILLGLGGILVGLSDGSQIHVPSYEAFILFNPAVHLYKFVFGMALAIWWIGLKKTFSPTTIEETFSVAAVAAFIPGSYFFLHAIFPKNSYFVCDQITDAVSVALFGAMIFVFAYQKALISKMLSAWWIVYLGEISFGVYMTHGITLSLLEKGLHARMASWWFPFCIVAILAVASTTYHLLEKPSRRLITRIGMRLWGTGSEIAHPVPIELVPSLQTPSES